MTKTHRTLKAIDIKKFLKRLSVNPKRQKIKESSQIHTQTQNKIQIISKNKMINITRINFSIKTFPGKITNILVKAMILNYKKIKPYQSQNLSVQIKLIKNHLIKYKHSNNKLNN